ncbi:Uncharacterised protein [Mycobacteroides abscessus subsp. bolletii]|uniref:hypothetical protein n=1 Tax=Mycobacteroides abscessus TaxID=36809 RepID=UPI0009279012|nr:hypothetical protein [Mycobacteroides abscessus]SHQ36391.1 Uncharacterised protein [Mycobacteroides abscessus subsp. bolletii]SHS10995.1 Uncharacterised protein [Mycobacteroides abscessus subsp. bolletii]SHS80079.1 Uncharacterised protein [Mycobacteroides abscessus subsp. bolletii]SHS83870.1 Uncharacterised protein [Mycobacteroides abscessus subsp. bolletii]SHX74114.1 Uncharacterised protein [Mycobacteroides abscessus subsp. bolletii]
MTIVVRIGLAELALGALLGWVVAANFLAPQLLRKAGVTNGRRFLQAHLDYIIMGILLIAVGLAVPDLPGWLAAVVAYGALLNPTLFLPMAFKQNVTSNTSFQVATFTSFVAMSGGLVLVAVQ